MKKLTVVASFLFCFALFASAETTHKHHHKKHHGMAKKDNMKEDKTDKK